MAFPNSRVVVAFPALPCARSFINSVVVREMEENSERTEEKERGEREGMGEDGRQRGGEGG